MKIPPEILIESYHGNRMRTVTFEDFAGDVSAMTTVEVVAALEKVETAVRKGFYAVGFISYEAAPGLDSALATKNQSDFPLLWFGLFRDSHVREARVPTGSGEAASCSLPHWKTSLGEDGYSRILDRLKKYIAAGDTYQVNFTLRLVSFFNGCTRDLYRDLCRAQRARYCAYLELGRYHILSASPELFFHLEEKILTVRPMKGTAVRGRWLTEDLHSVSMLKSNEKERAENLMIVDLLRNDMGRISETGSVTVESLFDVETLETVHQMTSTVHSRLRQDVGFVELLKALFPCGSITGAPKRRTMEIISELEDSPRGLYTGCIGYITPGMDRAVFSVAIRTVVVDTESGTAELGVGSGITWDSRPDSEYAECLAKGQFARSTPPQHSLLESMLFEEGKGYFLFERHLARLSESAAYLRFTLHIPTIRAALLRHAELLSGTKKVRLSVARSGTFSIETEELSGTGAQEMPRIAIAGTRVDSSNPFLYHKTSSRELYEREQAAQPDCVDVVFLNERDEITEGAFNNIVIRRDGEFLTPPLGSGLLPGTFRALLLATGVIQEKVLYREDLGAAEEIYLINSVRKWRRVRFEKGVFL